MVKRNIDGTYDVYGYGLGEPLYCLTKDELDNLRIEIENVRIEEQNMDDCVGEIKTIVNRLKKRIGG